MIFQRDTVYSFFLVLSAQVSHYLLIRVYLCTYKSIHRYSFFILFLHLDFWCKQRLNKWKKEQNVFCMRKLTVALFAVLQILIACITHISAVCKLHKVTGSKWMCLDAEIEAQNRRKQNNDNVYTQHDWGR